MSRFGKRLIDVLLAGTGILVSAPLWAVIAAAIKLETRARCFTARSGSARAAGLSRR